MYCTDMESRVLPDDALVVLENGAVPGVPAVYIAVSAFVADVFLLVHLVVHHLHTPHSQLIPEEPAQHPWQT